MLEYKYMKMAVKLLFINAHLSFLIGIFELARGINEGVCYSMFFIWAYPLILANCIGGYMVGVLKPTEILPKLLLVVSSIVTLGKKH